MKNKALILVTILSCILLNTACHKCVECTEFNSAGEKVLQWPETCGKKKEIEDYRQFMESVVNPNNKVQCTERRTSLF